MTPCLKKKPGPSFTTMQSLTRCSIGSCRAVARCKRHFQWMWLDREEQIPGPPARRPALSNVVCGGWTRGSLRPCLGYGAAASPAYFPRITTKPGPGWIFLITTSDSDEPRVHRVEHIRFASLSVVAHLFFNHPTTQERIASDTNGPYANAKRPRRRQCRRSRAGARWSGECTDC